MKKYRNYAFPLTVLALVLFFYSHNTFYMMENTLTDRLTASEREVHPSIKILAIDETSLDSIGRWPWPRDVLAQLAGQLADSGAKAIWLDVLYTEKSDHPAEDEAWEKVLQGHDNIYHSVYFELKDQREKKSRLLAERLFKPVFSVDKEKTGHINTIPDRDGVVRQAILGIETEGGTMVPAIEVRLANLLLSADEQIQWNGEAWMKGDVKLPANEKQQMYFSYASGVNQPGFEVLPVSSVIRGELDPDYFTDALVLIGPYALGISDDLFMTPVSKNARMYGVEIHANILQSLLDGGFYTILPTSLGVLILFLLAFAGYVLMERIKAKWAFTVFLGLAVGYTLVHFICFRAFSLVLPYFYSLLALFLMFVASVVINYLKERHERNRVTGIFGRYVSKSIVKEILQNQAELKLGGSRKDVTLLFVDIRGFTPLSEKMEPEEIILILNEYLDLCTKAIFAQGGTLDKFIGDGVMAIFGAPVSQEDHPARAVRAALDMKKGSAFLADQLEKKYGRSVSFGIGINSGPAVVGNIGSQERLDYTAIGDTVNLAARLEANAKGGQILVSQSTFERVRDQFAFTPLEAIKVKGREQWVELYQVDEESAAGKKPGEL